MLSALGARSFYAAAPILWNLFIILMLKGALLSE